MVLTFFACLAFIWLRELTIPSVSYRGLHIWRYGSMRDGDFGEVKRLRVDMAERDGRGFTSDFDVA